MMSKKRYAIPAVLATVCLVVGAVFWGQTSPGDLSLLAPYHAKYSYEKLIEEVNDLPPDPDSFRFVVLGDHRNNTHTAEMMFAKALEEDPAIIFDTGDLIRDGSVDQYLDHHLRLVEMAAPVPVFCVPGNHERGERHDFAGFKAIYGGTRFSFSYAGCRFVGFNDAEKLRVTGDDLAFADQELSKPGAEYKFVFFHVPPDYFENTIIGDGKVRGFSWNAEKLREILTQHQVTEVFMGHIHGHATAVIDDVRYSLTAGAGAPLSERLDDDQRCHHYLVVHVQPEGLWQERVYLARETGQWVRRTVYGTPTLPHSGPTPPPPTEEEDAWVPVDAAR